MAGQCESRDNFQVLALHRRSRGSVVSVWWTRQYPHDGPAAANMGIFPAQRRKKEGCDGGTVGPASPILLGQMDPDPRRQPSVPLLTFTFQICQNIPKYMNTPLAPWQMPVNMEIFQREADDICTRIKFARYLAKARYKWQAKWIYSHVYYISGNIVNSSQHSL